MTTLKIIPDFENKTAEFIGYPSAGEHVDVRIVGAANLLPSSTLRFRVKFGHVTLALFPRQGVNEVWEKEGDDLKCHLNLNTVQARSVCRIGNTVCHAILDQLGDDEHTVEPTLFFDDLFDVTPWYREPGADEPYDLDIYPNQIADLNQRVNAIGAKVAEAKNAAETAAGSANAAYESAQSAVEAAQTANARANSAESASSAAAVSAGRAEGALERIGSQVEEARNAATQAMASASSSSDSAAAAEEKADAAAESAESAASSASEAVSTVHEHAERDDNPHGVTKAQIGLGSVDNTSDMNKPVSHPQRRALDEKQDNLTARQLAAVNSGIDANKVAQIAANVLEISKETARAMNAEAILRSSIEAIGVMDVFVSDVLPVPSEAYRSKLYLIPSTNPETRNVKDEFICVKIDDVWKWEQIGSTAITIEFDNEPTEGSQKAVRSGGIWSWVKSLLPHWLTSDYAEPATVASVATKADKTALDDKRDKDDLAVYEKVGVGTSCTWESENDYLLKTYLKGEHVTLRYEESQNEWWPDPNYSTASNWLVTNGVEGGGPDTVSITFKFENTDTGDFAYATATRAHEFRKKSGESLAHTSATSGLAKLGADGKLVKAEKSSTSSDPANADYRDPQDNICHKTEYVYECDPESHGGHKYRIVHDDEISSDWFLYLGNSLVGVSSEDLGVIYDEVNHQNVAYTRSAVCSDGKRFVTEDVAAKQSDINTKANSSSFAPEYSATSAYSVGAIVYHDGSIYQCKTAIADGGEAWNAEHWELRELEDFFTESNSLLSATIDARLPYPLYTVQSTGLLKDRTINTTSLASVTVPDNFTDLLVRASVASSLSVTMPEAIATKYGDTFPGEAGEYLVTITKTGAAEAYVRTIKLEEVA